MASSTLNEMKGFDIHYLSHNSSTSNDSFFLVCRRETQKMTKGVPKGMRREKCIYSSELLPHFSHHAAQHSPSLALSLQNLEKLRDW